MASLKPLDTVTHTIKGLLDWGHGRIADVADDAGLDAAVLLARVLDEPRSTLFAWPERPVAANHAQQFGDLIERRRHGEPVAYLLGNREFWSLQLKVSPATLIPRPDTECLVERTLALLPADATHSVLDLGTGSGAIALALACERPRLAVTAVDTSPDALAVARSNAARLELEVTLAQSDWFSGLTGQRFAIIVANPPYVPSGDPHLGQGDLRFEPPTALDGGPDGLAALRTIIAAAPDHLLNQGWLLLEHGYDQGPAVLELLQQRGFHDCVDHADLAGRPRVAQARWPETRTSIPIQ